MPRPFRRRQSSGRVMRGSDSHHRGGQRSNRPPGLRGREIGLWHARKNRLKREEQLKNHGGVVRMNTSQLLNATNAIEASETSIAEPTSSSSDNSEKSKKPFYNTTSYWYNPGERGDDNWQESYDPTPTESTSSAYSRVLEFRKKLPAYRYQKELLELIHQNQVVVITGETGCGKTTQIPQYILDDVIKHGNGRSCRIVCTQPRRISAIAVAERVAHERNEKCGEGNSCGYQIKLQSSFPRRYASMLYCTTGIIIQCLQSDPLLSTISHIVLDEIHERDMQSDFLITVVKRIISKRKDLKVILMSATLNSEIFSTYFDDCPMFHVPGFTYPVTEYYLEETLSMTKYVPTEEICREYDRLYSRRFSGFNKRGNSSSSGADREAYAEELASYKANLKNQYSDQLCQDICCMDAYSQAKIDYDFIVTIVKYIVRNLHRGRDENGAILIFLPGWEDIKQVNKLLLQDLFFQPNHYRIIPLHSMMPTVQQKVIFERPPRGVTKIVIATNIAETSITIDDVVYVIDSGKIKMKNFEHDKNLSTLRASWETKANAKQRSGRAGRVQKGVCFRLYSKLQETKMNEYIVPEIVRTPLDQVCLQIKILKLGKIQEFLFQVMESPAEESVRLSLTKLTSLKALDCMENLTPLGYHLAQLPVEPQIGKMLLFGAIFSCIDPILTIAASLSFKDPFVVPLGKEKEADFERKRLARGIRSDHIMYANVFEDWQSENSKGYSASQAFCWRHFLSSSNLRMIKEMRVQFTQYLHDCGFLESCEPTDSSSNCRSSNLKVVQAVVCSGLYPNIARIFKHKHSNRPPRFSTATERKVSLHPKSVNCNSSSDEFQHEWLCYYEKMKTNQVNLYDTSEVSPYSLLFFGGDIETFFDDVGVHRISVDKWIKFESAPQVAGTVAKLRNELDKLLEMKVKHPQCSWDSAQRSVIDSIVELISQN